MSDTCPQELIDFAVRLADAARPVIREHFRTPVAVDSKADETPVTIADRQAETAIRALIAEGYPAHGIVGEEHGIEEDGAEYVWVIDPIDGTRSFIAGKPIFGTLVALVRNGRPILGIIDQAILDERWIGAAGRPTVFNGKEIRTRRCAGVDRALLSTTSPYLFGGDDAVHFDRLRRSVWESQYGGDCYAYALLATGFIDLVVEAGLKPYDFCALVPVIEGAGGVASDWQGRPLTLASDGRIVAAGDAALLPRVVEILNSP